MALNAYWNVGTSGGNTFGILKVLNGGTGLDTPGPAYNSVFSDGNGNWYSSGKVTSIDANLINPSVASSYMIWQAPFNCTLTGLNGYISTTTGSTINAIHNNSFVLQNDFTLTALNTWLSCTGLSASPISFVVGDSLQFCWQSIIGNPSQIIIQANVTVP